MTSTLRRPGRQADHDTRDGRRREGEEPLGGPPHGGPEHVRLLLDVGHADDALTHATTVLAAVPDDLAALRVAASAARALGDETRAASYGRLADALDPAAAHPTAPAAPAVSASPTVPDTADEVLRQWSASEPLVEPAIGALGPAGITMADICGLAEVKKRLELRFLAPLRNPELSLPYGKSLRGGLLLWGLRGAARR
nr:hypothetical protein [Saccharothrix espanaensis]